MKVQLSKAISVKNYTETVECHIDMEKIRLKGAAYPVLEKHSFPVILKMRGENPYLSDLRRKWFLESRAAGVLMKCLTRLF